jgi:hypothetical protein
VVVVVGGTEEAGEEEEAVVEMETFKHLPTPLLHHTGEEEDACCPTRTSCRLFWRRKSKVRKGRRWRREGRRRRREGKRRRRTYHVLA